MRLAIIGAGAAGLAAARALRRLRPDLAITVYEQYDRLGGRLLTGRRGGFVFDHGAQNLRAPTPELARLLASELPAADLRDIGLPVWTFDRAGAIAEGDPAMNAEPKWAYGAGLDTLGQLLADELDVRRDARVGSLRQATDDGRPASAPGSAEQSLAADRWSLLDTRGQPLGAADLVLLTPPAPQTAEIVAASELGAGPKQTLLAELARVVYRPCVSVALAYDRPVARPFYALVNIDRAHPIAWLALEHAKGPQRCPPDHSLLMAQMGARWSAERWAAPDGELVAEAASQAGRLLGEELHAPLWSDVHRWPYALPDGGADLAALNRAAGGLFFAGDYTAGLGRVHLAIESGWRAADLIDRALPH